MKPTLVPCPSCARHVRIPERNCPFCSADLSALRPVEATTVPLMRLGRATLFAFGATLALGDFAGCGAVYGGPVVDVGGTDATSVDTGADDVHPGDAALEGSADAGSSDGGVPNDDGSGGARYGAPPPPDGG